MSEPARPVDERFEVDAWLRPGRYGELWRARRRDDGTPVTLKLLKPELFKEGEAIRRFQREVKLLLEFEHPYLLRVLDHGLTRNGDPYLVLESVDGQLLSEVLTRGAVSSERARRIGAQIARVLAAAAARGIVHRGLVPDAILVHGSDDVKVLDFGLAIAVAADGEPRLTESGQRLGDPAYMAPEYIEAFQSDHRTDLYGLGILLYELLTGDPPFGGRSRDVLEAHVSTPAPPPSSRLANAAIPAWLDALVLALLDKDPERRPDATAVARALVAGQWPPPP